MDKVFHAAIALIKVGTITVGKAKNIRASESFQRGSVQGIGNLTKSEVPMTGFNGSLSIGFYTVDFSKHPMGDIALKRSGDAYSQDRFKYTHILREQGVTLDLCRYVLDKTGFPPNGYDSNGIAQKKLEVFARIPNLFIVGDNFDLNEGSISGRDSSFEYLEPVIYVN